MVREFRVDGEGRPVIFAGSFSISKLQVDPAQFQEGFCFIFRAPHFSEQIQGVHGICSAGSSAYLYKNTAKSNSKTGIYSTGKSASIYYNLASSNKQNGIYSVGAKAKIAKNTAVSNKVYGIYSKGKGSKMASNKASGNKKKNIKT